MTRKEMRALIKKLSDKTLKALIAEANAELGERFDKKCAARKTTPDWQPTNCEYDADGNVIEQNERRKKVEDGPPLLKSMLNLKPR